MVASGMSEPVEILIERVCAFKKKRDKKTGCERCGKAKTHRDHMGAPPSLRALGSGNQWAYQGLKHAWQSAIAEELGPVLPRGLERVIVEGECCFPDRARRDQGNFRFFLEKATGDALTEGGWLEDDDWTRYEFGGLAYRYEKGRSYTRLLIFSETAALGQAA
jgi:hypothetical protein